MTALGTETLENGLSPEKGASRLGLTDLMIGPDASVDEKKTRIILGELEQSMKDWTAGEQELDKLWAKQVRATAAALETVRSWKTMDEVDDDTLSLGDEVTSETEGLVEDKYAADPDKAIREHNERFKMLIEAGESSFDTKGFVEGIEPAEVLTRASEAAEGHTVMHTYLSEGAEARVGTTRRVQSGGYKFLGSGIGVEPESTPTDLLTHKQPDGKDCPSEYVQFLDTKDLAGIGLPETVKNPVTKAMEPPVLMRYRFSYNEADAVATQSLKLPRYNNPTGRGQQFLELAVVLPRTTARELQLVLAEQPKAIRALVDSLAVDQGGLSEAYWKGGEPGAMHRPPYEHLDTYEAKGNKWDIRVFQGEAA